VVLRYPNSNDVVVNRATALASVRTHARLLPFFAKDGVKYQTV
jgi:hypothetical protein